MLKTARVLVPLAGVFCLWPQVGSAEALLLGVGLALVLGNPYSEKTKAFTPRLLAYSVIALGAGMNLRTVAEAGVRGLGYTAASLILILGTGYLLMRAFRVERDAGFLITAGTAICGGSAIAALTPVLRARPASVSAALGCVFLLNATALVLFPTLGHTFALTQNQFGMWAALAIHDTSSVVGATLSYGAEAARIGTTVKLARALWIVPLTLAAAYAFRAKDTKTKKPWFILGFLLMAAIVTYIPDAQTIGVYIEMAGRRTLVLTLFLIGLGLSKETLEQVGWRPFAAGLLLWLLTSAVSLSAIKSGWISPGDSAASTEKTQN